MGFPMGFPMGFHEYAMVPFEPRHSPRNRLASPQCFGGHWLISTRIPVGSTQLHAGGIRDRPGSTVTLW